MPSLGEVLAAVASLWRPTAWEVPSSLPAAEAARRLDDDVAPLVALGRPEGPTVRGWARPSGLRLWVVWPDQRLAAGVRRHLSGFIEEAGEGSVLHGRFALPRAMYLGLLAGLVVLAALVALSLAGRGAPLPAWRSPAVVAVLVLLLLLGTTGLGLWQARHDEEMLRTWVTTRIHPLASG